MNQPKNNNAFFRVIQILIAAVCLVTATQAAALPKEQVPEPLKPWVDWVLQGTEDYGCPFLFNDGAQRRCAWPGRLELNLNDAGGKFAQVWQVYREAWVPLPGELKHWPQEVSVNGKGATVTERGGSPFLRLGAGEHRIQGVFAWERLPESLAIANELGLIGLAVNGNGVPFPEFQEDGRVWLRGAGARKPGEGVADSLSVQVFRRISDEIPLNVLTRLDLNVSGTVREITLGPALLQGFIPLSLESPLPARLEPDGRLRVQVRPGRWTVDLTARYPENIEKLALQSPGEPWPQDEIWTFAAQSALRLVQVEGVTAIDPQQTNLPEDWKSLPAYRLNNGEALSLKLIRRGDPEPEPDRLSLNRQLWLDFDGGGYTVNDKITGQMTRGWRLETQPVLSLGQATIDGQPQFITRLKGIAKPGIEVRRGQVNVSADSRMERAGKLSAVGWDQDFQQVNAQLNLPPGWRLFAVGGADNVRDTWLQRWTLLDIFMVLILSVACLRLWDWRIGLLALVTLALIWHEPGAPRYVWVHVLIAIALVRVLPEGKLANWVRAYRFLSFIALALIALPFFVDQVRNGLYPQLERPWEMAAMAQAEVTAVEAPQAVAPAAPPAPAAEANSAADAATMQADSMEAQEGVAGAAPPPPPAAAPAKPGPRGRGFSRELRSALDAPRRMAKQAAAPQLDEIDPNAKVQTGPGLPRWQWTQVPLSWNGPVQKDQELRIVLLSPLVNFILNLLRVLLIAALALGAYRLRSGQTALRSGPNNDIISICFISLFSAMLVAPETRADDLPTPALLEQLKQKLLEPARCLPGCANSPRLRLEASPAALTLRQEIHALEDVAVPLPASPGNWLPDTVTIDGKPAIGTVRGPDGQFWLKLNRGLHQVILAGPLPARDAVQLVLPLPPRRVEAKAEGWRVDGIRENGVPDGQLVLTRLATEQELQGKQALQPSALPPFVQVERTLHLGLEWRVDTRVVRQSPQASAVVLEVPLLPGESVTQDEVRVVNGKVQVNLAPDVYETAWQSVIDKQPKIELSAPKTNQWTEVWQADVSPIWHLEASGIPVVHHQSAEGRWLPEWRPWPGENIALTLTRPEGMAGQTLTIDRTDLRLSPGQRATDATLALTLRSGQGGQHSLTLPEGAQLQTVTIGGIAQPIRQSGQRVTLPLVPGKQEVQLNWRESRGISALFKTPAVDLGSASVNNDLHATLAQDRWTLFVGGPRLGPAVLFWGVLIVIALVAFILGRTTLTPLKSWQWFLLAIGLSQVPAFSGLIVVGWLFALGARARLKPDAERWVFDLFQIGLVLLTLFALVNLFEAIQQGLLGLPDMQISGNGSSAYALNWFQDRSVSVLPQAWILSVPLLAYRLLMLGWALWLAFALLAWLRWGWGCFSAGGMWRALKDPESRMGGTHQDAV